MIKITGLIDVIKYLNVELGFSFSPPISSAVFWHEVLDYQISPVLLPPNVEDPSFTYSDFLQQWDFYVSNSSYPSIYITSDSTGEMFLEAF